MQALLALSLYRNDRYGDLVSDHDVFTHFTAQHQHVTFLLCPYEQTPFGMDIQEAGFGLVRDSYWISLPLTFFLLPVFMVTLGAMVVLGSQQTRLVRLMLNSQALNVACEHCANRCARLN